MFGSRGLHGLVACENKPRGSPAWLLLAAESANFDEQIFFTCDVFMLHVQYR
jgi:hypothetical protein